jgi:hypothetical protein
MIQEKRTIVLKQISNDKCGQCGEPRRDHSSKNKIRCMYKADVTLYQTVQRVMSLKSEIKILKGKLSIEEDE